LSKNKNSGQDRSLSPEMAIRLSSTNQEIRGMRIDFTVGGKPAQFHRNPVTARVSLRVGEDFWQFQSPWSLAAHFDFSLRKAWVTEVRSHVVVVEVKRPLLFAGFRPMRYRILVDGQVVAERSGR
jgi:hypothetical protein